MLYMATGKQAHFVSKFGGLFFTSDLLYMFRVTIPPMPGRHDAEQQDSNYLQLHTTHTDRTTLLRTNLLTKCACLPVATYSTCTPDDGWDCHPKHVE